MYSETGNRLSEEWEKQAEYNFTVQSRQSRTEAEWMQVFILGITSELGELLEEMAWKLHRPRGSSIFGPNVMFELADITKYVISMWQVAGADANTMLDFLGQKNEILRHRWQQEFTDPVENKTILLLDLDGCVADFRGGFLSFVEEHPYWRQILKTSGVDRTLHLDVDYKWSIADYREAKALFEREGGYALLPPIDWVVNFVQDVRRYYHLAVYTARPFQKFSRVWQDSWRWLIQNNLAPDELYLGGEERIHYAVKMSEKNKVIAVDDNPEMVIRFAGNNIPVIMPVTGYNSDLANMSGVYPVKTNKDLYIVLDFIDPERGKNVKREV